MCLAGCSQTHSAQSDAGSWRKKTQMDKHAAAEGP